MAGQPGYYLFPNRTFIRKGANLTAAEADLIEAFAPVAVDEAGGFADFRETATKTNRSRLWKRLAETSIRERSERFPARECNDRAAFFTHVFRGVVPAANTVSEETRRRKRWE